MGVSKNRCSKCKIVKPVSAFARNRKASDGLSCWCRECMSDYKKRTGWHRKYWSAHREERRMANRRIQRTAEGKARQAVRTAVYTGKLHKPSRCQHCNKRFPKAQLEGHHPNHDRKLEVVWLCRTCHALVDCGAVALRHTGPVQGVLPIEEIGDT